MAIVQVETFSDLRADLSEKIGETTADSSDNRKRKINNAYFFIAGKRNWWWKEATSTATTTTALSYTLPTDFGVWHPNNTVKVGNDWRVIVPFKDSQLYDGTAAVVTLPSTLSKRKAYTYAGSIYFIQDSMTAGLTITYNYYKLVTGLENDADEPLMPIQFREMISLYAAGMQLKSSGGKESDEGNDYLKLYDSYLKQMEEYDDEFKSSGIKRRVRDPEEADIWMR